jgi:hypothetical protein
LLNEFFLYVLAGAGAAAAAGAAGGGTGTPNRRIEAPVVSDADEGAEIISPNHNQTSPSLELETLADPSSEDAKGTRHKDFKTSACSFQAPHLPSSPSQEGILTLKSFIIPYLKLGDLPSDITGGMAVISYSISWSKSCLIS